MSDLPPELIFAILEHVYYMPTGSPDRTLLANCSLVCTSWSVAAQSLLFRKTTRLQSPTILSFQDALKSSASRGNPMGDAVRSLDISVWGILNERCQPEVFVEVLQCCPRVYELTLSIFGLHEFDQFALAKLKHAGQGIGALNLLECGVQSPVLFQLLGIWPRIRFLKIGTEIAAWPWRHPAETPVFRQPKGDMVNNTAQRPPARVSLYDLSLSRIPQPAVLAWLLGSSASTLRILDLRDFPGIEGRECLGAHAPHLRSLRLLHFSIDSAAFLRQCIRLEELIIYTIPIFVPFASALPRTIEHLSFRNPRYASRRTLSPILDAIEILPKLRMVTCDKESQDLHDFALLKTRCAEKGVELAVTSEAPFWVMNEDPVIVDSFPRRRSVSNFRLMTG